MLRIHGCQLFHDGVGKAHVGDSRHGAAAAAQRTAQSVLVGGDGQTQAGPRLCKGIRPAHRAGRRIRRHQNDPCVLAAGGRAHRLLTDLHTARLFGKADH